MEHETSQKLVRSFLTNSMSEEEREAFLKRLTVDKALLKEFNLQNLMKDAMHRSQKNYESKFRKIEKSLNKAFEEYYQEKEQYEEKTYTLEELLDYFTPNTIYNQDVEKSESNQFDLAITRAKILRSGKKGSKKELKGLEVLSPKNTIESEYELDFRLAQKYKVKLLLTIFDNQGNRMAIGEENIDKKVSLEDDRKDIIITKKTKKFSLLLSDFKPGIYYWRLKAKSDKLEGEYKEVTRSFYIRKNLMPKNLLNPLA